MCVFLCVCVCVCVRAIVYVMGVEKNINSAEFGDQLGRRVTQCHTELVTKKKKDSFSVNLCMYEIRGSNLYFTCCRMR